jgi:hypothetical protein
MQNTLRMTDHAESILTFSGTNDEALLLGAPSQEAIYRLQRTYGPDIRGVQQLAQLLGEEGTVLERQQMVQGMAAQGLVGKPGGSFSTGGFASGGIANGGFARGTATAAPTPTGGGGGGTFNGFV